MVLKAYI